MESFINLKLIIIIIIEKPTSGLFKKQTCLDHLYTKLVWYSDVYCTQVPNCIGIKLKFWTNRGPVFQTLCIFGQVFKQNSHKPDPGSRIQIEKGLVPRVQTCLIMGPVR